MRRVAAEKRDQKVSNKTDAKKFMPGLDPLEKESVITDIQPLGKVEADRMMKLINRLLAKGGLSPAEKKAFYFWKANLVVENAQGVIHQEFMRDFWAWLLGRGKETDHKKSPWYRQSLCNDSEVSAYVDSFVTKRHDFQVKLQLLSMRHPVGINQHYLYFKYVVRGEPPNSDHFLDDWGLFQDEFYEARELGQKERNRDDVGQEYQGENAFHEMAPYGSVREQIGKKSHDLKAKSMVLTAARSWKNDDLSDEEGEEVEMRPPPPEKPKKVLTQKTDSVTILDDDDGSSEEAPLDVGPSSLPPPPPTDRKKKPGNDKRKEEMDEVGPSSGNEPRDENRAALSPRRSKEMEDLKESLRAALEGGNQRILDELDMDRARRQEQLAGEAKKRLDDKRKELAEKQNAAAAANLKDKILEEAIEENSRQTQLVAENLEKLIQYQKLLNETQLLEMQRRDDRIALELANVRDSVNKMEGKIGRNVASMEAETQRRQVVLHQSVVVLAEQMEIMQKEMLDMNVRLQSSNAGSAAAVDRVIAERLSKQTLEVQQAMREAVANIKAPDFEELKNFVKSREAVLQAGLMKEIEAANGNLKLAVQNYERELKNAQGAQNSQISEAISLAKSQMADAINSLKQGNLIDVQQLQKGILSAIGDKLNAVDMQRVIDHFQSMEGKLNSYATAFTALEKSKVFDAPAALKAIQKNLDVMQQTILGQEARVKESSGKVTAQAASIAKLEDQIAAQKVTIETLNQAGEREKADFISAMQAKLTQEKFEAQEKLRIYESQNRENIKNFVSALKHFEEKIDQIDRDGIERARNDRREIKELLQNNRLNEAAAAVQAEAQKDIENDNMPPLEEMPSAAEAAKQPEPIAPTFTRIGNWLQGTLHDIFGAEPAAVGDNRFQIDAEVKNLDSTERLLEKAQKDASDVDIDDLIKQDQANQEIDRLEKLEILQRQQLAHDLRVASEQEEAAAQIAAADAAERERHAKRSIQLHEAAERVGTLRSSARVKEGTFAGQQTSEKKNAPKLVAVRQAPGKSGGASTAPKKVAKGYAKNEPGKRSRGNRVVNRIRAEAPTEVVAEAVAEAPLVEQTETGKRVREEENIVTEPEKTLKITDEEVEEQVERALSTDDEIARAEQNAIFAIARNYFTDLEIQHFVKYVGDPRRDFSERQSAMRDFLLDMHDRAEKRIFYGDEETED